VDNASNYKKEVTLYGNIEKYFGATGIKSVSFAIINGTEIGTNPAGGGGGDTPSGDVKTVTVAEFNAAAESTDVWYKLTGTISNLKDGDQYGNFDLEDATGSVYVYGLLSEKGGEKKKFHDLVEKYGLANGSTITIIGKRGSYNGKIEVTNAYIVIDGNGGGDTPGGETGADGSTIISVADFNAAAESTDVWYQLTGTIKNLKDGDQYGNFDLEDSTGSVYVYGVLSEKGGAKKKFLELVAEKGIANGKKITIVGNRGSYNGKIEVMNAYFIKVE
jgi:RPA family protein